MHIKLLYTVYIVNIYMYMQLYTVQALNLYCKIMYMNSSLKSFKAYLFIIISMRNDEFQSEVCLDDRSHFNLLQQIGNCK